MELSEKIQQIRKEYNLTQEQLANKIYVSRAAVSKWETGRGIPSIDSLQTISKVFEIKLDDLLSCDEIIGIAQEEKKESFKKACCSFDAMLNIGAILSLFLPLYKSEEGGVYYSTYLGNFEGWQGIFYWIIPILLLISGAVQLILNHFDFKCTKKIVKGSSFALIILIELLSILSLQPYPAAFFLFMLLGKGGVAIYENQSK